MSTTPMTKIREEFEKKFAGETAYTDYPVEIIADWFINRFQRELEKLEGEIKKIDFYGWDERTQKLNSEKVLAIIRQHKQGYEK